MLLVEFLNVLLILPKLSELSYLNGVHVAKLASLHWTLKQIIISQFEQGLEI